MKMLNYIGQITIVLSLLFLFSCAKDPIDPPSTNEYADLPSSLVKSYTGDLSYVPASGMLIASNNGTATISKSGDTYTISFSDNVPSITGLNFKLDSGGSYASVSSDGSVTGISLDDEDFDIGATEGGNTWSFASN